MALTTRGHFNVLRQSFSLGLRNVYMVQQQVVGNNDRNSVLNRVFYRYMTDLLNETSIACGLERIRKMPVASVSIRLALALEVDRAEALDNVV